jgi:hypothetical protein
MALLPYTNRVTTQRTSRDRGPGGPGRADGPPPRPQGPPPTGGEDRGDVVNLDDVLDIEGDGEGELVLDDGGDDGDDS